MCDVWYKLARKEEQIENTTPVGSLIRLEVTVKFTGHSSLKQGWQSVTS